jgi:L-seryl-tRNA(Ser) seleniumtransferase
MGMSPTTDLQALMRRLPAVDKLIDGDAAAALLERHPRPEVLTALRAELEAAREAIKTGAIDAAPDASAICAAAATRLASRERQGMCRVVNATGVVLHTGLGRAVLPQAARDAIAEVAAGYSLLEVDRATGERGERERYVRELLCELTGAESATVVNNNAAATMIVLAALARGKEVVVSRGQLVEIGGSFRIPEVMAESGAILREVGATNRTHLKDYAEAIGENTGLLMRVHTSNFRIAGFTKELEINELVALGNARGIPVVDDLGSGAMTDLERHGLVGEPLVSSSIEAGTAVAMFSGDKLLGGPQAGCIVGTATLVEKIRRHPVFRAVRPDKLQLAGLEATLRCYRDPDRLPELLPTLGMLTVSLDTLRERAAALAAACMAAAPRCVAAVADDVSSPGSGSLPTVEIPTAVVRITAADCSPTDLAARLRAGDPPCFARIKDDAVVLDLRTVLPGEEQTICDALQGALRV